MAAGATGSQYQFFSRISVLSDLLITQDNYPNQNTGTTFTNRMDSGPGVTITKEGYGNVQFNYHSVLTPGDFQGQFVINRGGVRMLGLGAMEKSTGITVNSGGQLQIAESPAVPVNNWTMAPGATLKLNGLGKAIAPGSIATSTPEGALRFDVQSDRSTTFHVPIVLQSNSAISVVHRNAFVTIDSIVSGPGGLTKHGDGYLTISNPASGWGGDTHLLSAQASNAISSLGIINPILADGRDVYVANTPQTELYLDFDGVDVIRSLFVDNLPQPPGTYGAQGNTSAQFWVPWIQGGGLLQVSSLGSLQNADFDGNGHVDGADFLIWQRNVGGTGGRSQGDANLDSNINGADLTIWKNRFGMASIQAAAAAIPEPETAAIVVAAVCWLLPRCRRQ
jgi:hypothetical protein